ncbi:MAG: 2Fe-2S iron-sulfur cluster-binding protein [Gammaproteobacteria bacterium]|nr:2Fe-2S iron-sulfur cluster-binding protein [Gammaproteobacteria bacterium]
MGTINVIDSTGESKKLEIDEGVSLMEHLLGAGYDEVPAVCGGSCSCATCHVYITNESGHLGDVEIQERELLEMADDYNETKSRLSCQIELDESHDGLEVTLIKSGV